MSTSDLFSLQQLLRRAHNACLAAIESLEEGPTYEGWRYRPLDTTNSTPSTLTLPSDTASTATRRGPRNLLQLRWAKLLMAGALLVLLCLVISVIGMASTAGDLAINTAGATTGGSKTVTPETSEIESDSRPAHKKLTLDSIRETISKEEYVDAVLRNPVEGLLDPMPIRKMCDATKFQQGLVWHCELVNGGIGNVGNMWLNCLRYAVEAGATTIILPRIGARDEANLDDLGGGERSVDLSTLYDIEYFITSWNEACPQMRAVISDKQVPNIPPVSKSPAIKANNVAEFPRNRELILDPTDWRKGLDAWLLARVPEYKTMTAAKPLRVRQRLALSNWNREFHDSDFAVSFPRLFRFPEQTRRLAAATLWSLEKKSGQSMISNAVLFPELTMNVSDSHTSFDDTSSIVTSLGTNRLVPQGYLGVHLRVADDAAKAKWPGYEAQAPAYLDEAQRRNLSIVYLATGSEKHRKMFRADAAARGISVVTKEDMLTAEELAELQKLSWDQQAIVDFEVLVHSSYFAGFVRSSFSWVVAIRRSILPEAGAATVVKREVLTKPRLKGHARRQERAAVSTAVAQSKASSPSSPQMPTASSVSLTKSTSVTMLSSAVLVKESANPSMTAIPPAAAASPVTTIKEDGEAISEAVLEKYRDGLSVIVGRYDAMTIMGIWP